MLNTKLSISVESNDAKDAKRMLQDAKFNKDAKSKMLSQNSKMLKLGCYLNSKCQ